MPGENEFGYYDNNEGLLPEGLADVGERDTFLEESIHDDIAAFGAEMHENAVLRQMDKEDTPIDYRGGTIEPQYGPDKNNNIDAKENIPASRPEFFSYPKEKYDASDKGNIGDKKLDNKGIWNKIKNFFKGIKDAVADFWHDITTPGLLYARMAGGKELANKIYDLQQVDTARQIQLEKEAMQKTINECMTEIEALRTQINNKEVKPVIQETDNIKAGENINEPIIIANKETENIKVNQTLERFNLSYQQFNNLKNSIEQVRSNGTRTPAQTEMYISFIDKLQTHAADIKRDAAFLALCKFKYKDEEQNTLAYNLNEQIVQKANECLEYNKEALNFKNELIQEQYIQKMDVQKEEINKYINGRYSVLTNGALSAEDKNNELSKLENTKNDAFKHMGALNNEYIEKGVDKEVAVGYLQDVLKEMKEHLESIDKAAKEAIAAQNINNEKGDNEISDMSPEKVTKKEPVKTVNEKELSKIKSAFKNADKSVRGSLRDIDNAQKRIESEIEKESYNIDYIIAQNNIVTHGIDRGFEELEAIKSKLKESNIPENEFNEMTDTIQTLEQKLIDAKKYEKQNDEIVFNFSHSSDINENLDDVEILHEDDFLTPEDFERFIYGEAPEEVADIIITPEELDNYFDNFSDPSDAPEQKSLRERMSGNSYPSYNENNSKNNRDDLEF